MRIAIRADASPRIGSGHVMRCLALADRLRQRGDAIRFLCRHLPEGLERILRESGHEVARLPFAPEPFVVDPAASPYAAWLGASWERDAGDCLVALSDGSWDWLAVDHYALDGYWAGRLREAAAKILVIDDLADRPLDCDLLLDQNLQAQPEVRYTPRLFDPARTRCLLGPRYALLRPEFARLAATMPPRDGSVSRLLIALGGADMGNVTGLLTDCALDVAGPDIGITIVVGAMHPAKETLSARIAGHLTARLVADTREMGKLMAASDLAIGAGGSMNWERMCLGLPAILVALEHNQAVTSAHLADLGLVTYLGDAERLDPDHIKAVMRSALSGSIDLARQSREGMALVDGLGAERVAAEMLRRSAA